MLVMKKKKQNDKLSENRQQYVKTKPFGNRWWPSNRLEKKKKKKIDPQLILINIIFTNLNF